MVKTITIEEAASMYGFDKDMIESIGISKGRLYLTIYNEEFGIRCGYVSVLNMDPVVNYRKNDITYASVDCPIRNLRVYVKPEMIDIMNNTRMWIGFDWVLKSGELAYNKLTKDECVDACLSIIEHIEKI